MASTGALYLEVAENIARSIRSGVLARGERMPSVRTLALQQGVSVSTAIQAYRALEDARLIESRPRSGTFVAARPAPLPEPETTRPPVASQPVQASALAVRVMQLATDARYVSFGAACPGPELFDHDRIRRAVTRAALRHRDHLTRYAFGTGQEPLRRAIARHALAMGCQLDPERIVVTNGCRDALVLGLRAITQPGDVVALESPTYFGLLEILRHLGLRALEIPTHPRHGLALDALQLALDTQPVKAVLAVPTLSNPIGANMPVAERKRLVRLLAAHDVPLVEDVIYNDLCEQAEWRRAVRSFDSNGLVLLCGSFSKTLAPGVNLGWIEPGRWFQRVAELKGATSGSQTAVLELAMAELLTQPGNESNYRQLRAAFARRVDEARAIVGQSFPRGTRVTDPPGGYILWLELPDAVDAQALFEACLVEHIVIAPGGMFSSTDRYRHCVRLGVAGTWGDAQRQALRRVGAIARAMAAEADSRLRHVA
jgi:DNA-binding transcriptional MocR family regulator